MSFGLQIQSRASHGRIRPSGRTTGHLTALAIAFVAFCIFDYSPYGYGYVSAALGDAQRWFRGFVASFRLKM
jgi:hypothetical protein